jgi:hypothetical protein
MNAKNAKMGQDYLNMPFRHQKDGVSKVINAANTQCMLAPNDCPIALILLGNISEIKPKLPHPALWHEQQ